MEYRIQEVEERTAEESGMSMLEKRHQIGSREFLDLLKVGESLGLKHEMGQNFIFKINCLLWGVKHKITHIS